MPSSNDWVVWALLSAVFAAATAILAKVGLEGIDSDFATLVRTLVIGCVLDVIVYGAFRYHRARWSDTGSGWPRWRGPRHGW